MRISTLWLLLCGLVPFGPAIAAQPDSPTTWRLEAASGIEYDSNVAVLELDTVSGESDVAASFDFGAGVSHKLTEPLTFKAGYDFSQSLYQDFDEYDLRIHRLSAETSYEFSFLDAGVMYNYAHASLDDSEFLVMQQVSPYVSRMLGERAYGRLAIVFADKDFDTSAGRDADALGLSTDLFYFVNGAKTYVSVGYRHDDEDAIDEQFGFSGHRLKVQLAHRLGVLNRDLQMKLRGRYEIRDYKAPATSIGVPREDKRYRIELVARLALGEHWSIESSFEYSDNQSNLPSVDFDEHIAALSVNAKL